MGKGVVIDCIALETITSSVFLCVYVMYLATRRLNADVSVAVQLLALKCVDVCLYINLTRVVKGGNDSLYKAIAIYVYTCK